MTPPHNGSRPSSTAAARWKTARKYGPYAAAISGSLANAIQILTVETPTTAGLVISGIVIATCLPLATFLTGRSHGRRKAVALTKEIQGLQGVLEATFGSHQPYNDTRGITFDIGRHPDEDLVEEWHLTTPDQGPVVYWGKFDAFSRGREHTLDWDDIDLHITRIRRAGDEGSPQFAKFIRLQNDKAPSALIAFAPPRDSVEWVAAYKSPGYWNVLREGVQPFVWNLPRVSADDPSNRRSPLQRVTITFRVPIAMGELIVSGPSEHFRRPVTENGGPHGPARNYSFCIDDVSTLLGQADSSTSPIHWHLELKPEGRPRP